MSESTLRIVWIYPDLLSTYGDRGNMLILAAARPHPSGRGVRYPAPTMRILIALAPGRVPRLDGVGLIKGLRADERTRDVPIVVLSARAGEEASVEGLMAGAGRVLRPGCVLYLYGPFRENGVHTAPSNAVFDESLRARNPEWGVRDVADLTELARAHRLSFAERVSMPANNLSLIFRRNP